MVAAAGALSKEPPMLSTSSSRKVVVLLLLAILAVPLVATAGPERDNLRREVTFLASDYLGRLVVSLKSAWNATGCMIDPSGKCVPSTNQEPQPGPETDEGHRIDPNG